jgi:hypothetical protein
MSDNEFNILKPGKAYRWNNFPPGARHKLYDLIAEGTLRKISRGLYYCPYKTDFGMAPPNDHEVIRAFLRDASFLLISLNADNVLGIGTTQLYNEQRVYNLKRQGRVTIGKRTFHFIKKRAFHKTLTPEFLLVDLIDNIDRLAEDRGKVMTKAKRKALSMDEKKLRRMVRSYGGIQARRFFAEL